MKALLFIIGVIVLPLTISERQGTPLQMPDSRLQRLEHFFSKRRSPLLQLSSELLIAADKNGLDWRLLPSISIVESEGGKACRNNNVFGWLSGKRRFPSIQAGIHYVANRLAHSRLYEDRQTMEKLSAYNPVPGYPRRIAMVMDTLENTEVLTDRVNGTSPW